MKIAVFYHCSKMGHYKEVDKEIMKALSVSGLLDNVDVFVKNEIKDLEKFEFPTLEMLREFARRNPEYYILYLHSKGVSWPADNQPIKDWRDCMLYFLVENWRDCVKKLNEGYDVAGINYIRGPRMHFQGNFWWAKANYLKDLCELKKTIVYKIQNYRERHKCEMWVLSGTKKFKFHEFYHHHIDPYKTCNPKENYIKCVVS